MAETELQIYIQSTAGSNLRLQVDEQTLQLKKTLALPATHPWPYGFVLNTKGEDGDCLDCFLLSYRPFQAGQTVSGRLIGMLELWENEQADHKLLAGLPGETINLNAYERDVLVLFLESVFAVYQDIHIQIGRILPAQDAVAYITQHKF